MSTGSTGFVAGMKCWIPAAAATECFELVEVLREEVSGSVVVVSPTRGQVKLPATDVSMANPALVADNCSLLHLSDATLLHNTRERFFSNDVYTYTGAIITSINPCTPLPALYSLERMQARGAQSQ